MTTTLPGAATAVPDDRTEPDGVTRPDGDAEVARPATGRARWSAGRLLRGPESDPVWARPALLALLGATAMLYLWGLGASGWANAFYSAAAQAGSDSWKAFFFGSSDAANSITVDKTPAALWVMALSVRLFGLSSWSILVPQALMGVAATGLLYATVRRWYGPVAGLLAGLVLATTPVAVLMFRFNNPDALLVLLLVAGAYATTRAIERASTRWLVWTGVFIGFGFLAKMLQALLVVPVFALVYLVAAPTPVRRRIVQLLWAGLAMVAAAGWWVAIVELIPARYRPYVGGSQNNSILELALGYNGLGRLNGDETGSVGGGQGGGWGQTGLLRLFNSEMGGQVAWLLPAALIALVAGLVLTRRAPRTDRARAGLLLWGGWLLVTGLIFSYMQGIFHAYYNVALAPAVGALVGAGGALLWRERRHPAVAFTLTATTAITAWWSWTLLGRSADWHPWVRVTVLALGLGAAGALLLAAWLPRRVAGLAATAALAAALLGPVGYAMNTAASAHTGAIPTAGPAVSGGGFGGGRAGGGFGGRPGGVAAGQGGPGAMPNGGAAGNGNNAGTGTNGGQGNNAQGNNAQGNNAQGNGGQGNGAQGNGAQNNGAQNNGGGGPGMGNGGMGRGGGGFGGLLSAADPSAEVVSLLNADAGAYTWVAAAVGSNNAAGYQLSTQEPVMAVGGFNGSDPSPTLAQFQQYVAAGKIHYFIGGTIGQSNGGSDEANEIAEWVAQNYTATTVDGVTLYDLSGK